MTKKYKIIFIFIIVLITSYIFYSVCKKINPNLKYEVGQKLDSLNGVYIYYNGGVGHTGKRNLSEDGYNIGLTYQCVEFVKRYYYLNYKHKMPDSYGNAKDFFDSNIKDSHLNEKRNLLQFTNPSSTKPCIGDLIIFDGHAGNKYGHVAIISNVADHEIEIIQQNPGPFATSRVKYPLKKNKDIYTISHNRVLGWLRMK
ncbi:MAG: CHAP domain-containing protein [Bacteroidetes bacterium]|nr:CHAP domain-containing protein [Bacteroidota bacterium]